MQPRNTAITFETLFMCTELCFIKNEMGKKKPPYSPCSLLFQQTAKNVFFCRGDATPCHAVDKTFH